jgi:hypothetical protein
VILFQTLYLPTGFDIGIRFTSASVAASNTMMAPPDKELPEGDIKTVVGWVLSLGDPSK